MSILYARWILIMKATIWRALMAIGMKFHNFAGGGGGGGGGSPLLPLLTALLATALTFGVLALTGSSLTVAQVAVLPVLIGLAVDYAVQLQSRVGEILVAQGEGGASDDGAGSGQEGMRDRRDRRRIAVCEAARVGAPTIAVAVTAGAAATLVLLSSPVPMVRGFAVLLTVGVAIAFACALTVGSAALVLGSGGGLRGTRRGRDVYAALGEPRLEMTGVASTEVGHGRAGAASGEVGLSENALTARARARTRVKPFLQTLCTPLIAFVASAARRTTRITPAWRGAQELLADNPLTRGVSSLALTHAVRRPERVLLVGLALAVLGWGLGTQTPVQTDLTKLVPQNTTALRNLNTLERLSGVGGEIDLMVSGKNVLAPKTIEWMSAYESAMLRRFGYTSTRGCGHAKLCPAFSLPDLFGREGAASAPSTSASSASTSTSTPTSTPASASTPAKLTSAQVHSLLNAIPPYFSQEVISPDRRAATLAFGIKLMGLDEQQQVIEAMRAALHPPTGVSAQLVGLPVLAAQANAQVASPWRRAQMLLLGLAAVALVLTIAFRGNLRRVLVPFAPIVLASGWSELVLFATRIPLNPMSVTLGVLVIAIATEFSVLLSERQRQEREAGSDLEQALHRTYGHTGAAVATSAVTAIMGFGVLVLSNIAMLRDFGLVTLIDLSVALIGVLIALPATLALAEREGSRRRLRAGGGAVSNVTRRRRPWRESGRDRPGHEPV
jgi:uncharacterized protein